MPQSFQISASDFVVRSLRALDRRDYDLVVQGFGEKGVWERGGEVLVGRDAVSAAMSRRPKDLSPQHIAANITVESTTDVEAVVSYTILAYVKTADKPLHLHDVFTAEDHLVAEGGEWRISRRAVSPAFAD